MLNTNEVIENASFEWIDGLYIKITGSVETLTVEPGADRLIISKGIYDALYEKFSGEMYIPATDDNFRDHLLKTGGISQIRFIHFVYNAKWYAITVEEAMKYKIKEDTFNYDAFSLGRFYNLNEIESDEFLMNAYDFNEHELWEQGQKLTKHNRKIDKLLAQGI